MWLLCSKLEVIPIFIFVLISTNSGFGITVMAQSQNRGLWWKLPPTDQFMIVKYHLYISLTKTFCLLLLHYFYIKFETQILEIIINENSENLPMFIPKIVEISSVPRLRFQRGQIRLIFGNHVCLSRTRPWTSAMGRCGLMAWRRPNCPSRVVE